MALKKNSRRTGIGSAVKSLGSAVTSSVKSQAQKAGVTGSSGGDRVSQDIRGSGSSGGTSSGSKSTGSSTAKGAALGGLATGGSAIGSLIGGIAGAVSNAIKNNQSGGGSSGGSTGGSSSGTHWSPSQSTGSSGGYIPYDPSGNDYASMAGMSSIDRAALAAAGAAWNQANARGDQAAKDAAHAQAEAIRSRYAYSGGGDGSQYIPTGNNYTQELNQLKAQLEEVAAQKPQYSGDKYDTSSIIDQLTGMDYADWTKSDQYKALADRYGAQGQMSMQDVLGQISSRTGGLASSYATTAAQQQYNDYMAQLEEIARQMYSGDRRDLIENLGVMNDANSVGYNRYLNELGQYNTDYSNLYNQYRDLIGDSQWNQNFQYQQNRDSISDKRYDQEYADSRSDYADSQTATSKADAQNRINAYLAAYGAVADLDPSLVSASGYTQSELNTLARYYTEQKAMEQAAAARSGGSSSGSSRSSSRSGSFKSTSSGAQDYSGLFEAAQQSGYPKSFIANNYKKYGFTSSSGLYDEYQDWGSGSSGGSDDYSLADLNTADVLNLGLGPVSFDRIEKLIESGEVVTSPGDDGRLHVKWAKKNTQYNPASGTKYDPYGLLK